MKKRVLIPLGIVTVLGTGGLLYAKQYTEQMVGKQILASVKSQNLAGALKNPKLEQQVLSDVNASKKPARPDNQISTTAGKTSEIASDKTATTTGDATNSSNSDGNQQTSNNNGLDAAPQSEVATAQKVDDSTVTALAKQDKVETSQDAVKFVEKRLTPTQLIHTIELYNNRNNLTQEQKQAAKTEVLSHFSPEELAMLLKAAKK